MKNYKEYFNNKKITVMGLGLLGRGVGDITFLAECGADLIVTDVKKKEELAPSLEKLKKFRHITFVLGEHRLEDFRNRDMVLKAAGVPLDSPYIEEAQRNEISVEMSTSLFAKLTVAQVIGITGTRGKSTVTHMLYNVLQKAFSGTKKTRLAGAPASPAKRGESPRRKVFLGGNVKGVSTLNFLKTATASDIAVLELDSWQLQGFAGSHISPHISIFTTLLPDHLNYYKGSMDLYLADKANIFTFQKENDILILGEQAAPFVLKRYKKEIKSTITIVSEQMLPRTWKLKIPGTHNRYNAALVRTVAEKLKIKKGVIKNAIVNFKGVPGRLECVRSFKGVKIYNDTTATTPDATLAGLKALGDKKNIILIMGGADKNLNMETLIDSLPQYTKSVILLPGSGSIRIHEKFEHSKIKSIKVLSLKEAVIKAISIAMKGDIILFSPAFASFGMFINEFDRGEQFNEIVKSL